MLKDISSIVKKYRSPKSGQRGQRPQNDTLQSKIDTKRERQKLFHSKPEPLRVPQQNVNKFKLELRNRYAILEEQQDLNYKNVGINDLNKTSSNHWLMQRKIGETVLKKPTNSLRKRGNSWRNEVISNYQRMLEKRSKQ